MLCLIACAIVSIFDPIDEVDAVDEVDEVESVRRLVVSGRYALALARVTGALDGAEAPILPPRTRRELETFRARCLFSLGRWPDCERSLRRLLDTGTILERERSALMIELAKVCSRQSAHAEASRTIDRALDIEPSETALRAAIGLALHARRFEQARPRIAALLARRPRDAYGLFTRGIVRSRAGDVDSAIEDLRHGLLLEGALRDTRFELALALSKAGRPTEALRYAVAILEEDPYDAEACYRATRALLERGHPSSARLAALLVKYFERLGAARGSSSRAEHLAQAGRPSAAAVMRSARRERLGDLAGAVLELDRGVELEPTSQTARSARARFRIRHGLLALADDDIDALESAAPGRSTPTGTVEDLRAASALARRRLQETAAVGTSAPRQQLSRSTWKDAAGPLRRLLAAARESGDTSAADRAARLLLARAPDSVAALTHLLERTTDPALIVPHLHYLRRLSDLPSVGERFKKELTDVRRTLTGGVVTNVPDSRP